MVVLRLHDFGTQPSSGLPGKSFKRLFATGRLTGLGECDLYGHRTMSPSDFKCGEQLFIGKTLGPKGRRDLSNRKCGEGGRPIGSLADPYMAY